jgi:hypothetical protein
MTWGGTKNFFREIVTLETGDMPQKVFFGAFWTHCMKAGGGGTLSKIFFENYMFKPAMGSCIKVPTEKKKVSKASYKSSNFSHQCFFFAEKCAIFCVRYSQNYKLTPAPSENCEATLHNKFLILEILEFFCFFDKKIDFFKN